MRSFLRAKKREFASADGAAPPVDLGAEPLQGRRVRPEVPRSLAQLVSSMRERSLFVLALQPQAAAAPASAAAPRPAPLAPSGSFGGAGYALKRSTSGGGSGLLLASGHSASSTGSDRDRDAVSMMHQKWASLLPAATLQPLLSRYMSSSAAEDAEAAAAGGAVPLPPAQQRWGLARQRSLQRAISEAPDDLLAAAPPAAGDDELQDEYTALAEEELAEGAGAVELGEEKRGRTEMNAAPRAAVAPAPHFVARPQRALRPCNQGLCEVCVWRPAAAAAAPPPLACRARFCARVRPVCAARRGQRLRRRVAAARDGGAAAAAPGAPQPPGA